MINPKNEKNIAVFLHNSNDFQICLTTWNVQKKQFGETHSRDFRPCMKAVNNALLI